MDLRARAMSMDAAEARDMLLDVIETYQREWRAEEAAWLDRGLSRSEAKLASLLAQHSPNVVAHDALLDRLYYDRHPDDWGDVYTLQALMHRIRKKLPGVEITSVWGYGYRMVRNG